MNRAQRRAAEHKRAPTGRTFNPTAWAEVIVGSRETDAALADVIAIRVRDAFVQLSRGTTDHDMFDRVACALNVGLIRAEAIDTLLEQSMLAGRDALMHCDRIYASHGRYGFTGPGLAAMDQALEAYEAILRASTPHQMRQAMLTSLQRMHAGHVLAPLPPTTPNEFQS